MKEERLQILLKEINLISKEHKITKKKDAFNIFKIIRKGHEEVGLHSKFLFELLSPFGSHKKKDVFFKLFIQQLGIKFSAVDVHVNMETENIDLLIRNRSQAIIIENKIYAGDQPEQLSRYYDTIVNKRVQDVYIIYLSLDGKPPSDQSIKNIPKEFLKETRLLNKSYSKFINPWLSLCLKECATEPTLRETIVQYQQLLKQLTMSDEVNERLNLLSLLGKDNNMEQAEYLVRNWVHMKWHLEMYFWNTMRDNIPEGLKKYNIVQEYSYSREYINGTVHGKRNRVFDYGISLSLFNFKSDKIYFFIERGMERVEYGIVVDYTKGKKDFLIKDTNFDDYIIKKFPNGFPTNENTPWLHWKYPKKEINFETFNNSDTLNLANEDKRLATVKELWQEISEYIETVMKWDGIPLEENISN